MQYIETLENYFNSNQNFENGFYWQLMRGHATTKSKSSQNFLDENIENGDFEESLNLLLDSVQSNADAGERSMHVRIFLDENMKNVFAYRKITTNEQTERKTQRGKITGFGNLQSNDFISNLYFNSLETQRNAAKAAQDLATIREQQKNKELAKRVKELEEKDETPFIQKAIGSIKESFETPEGVQKMMQAIGQIAGAIAMFKSGGIAGLAGFGNNQEEEEEGDDDDDDDDDESAAETEKITGLENELLNLAEKLNNSYPNALEILNKYREQDEKKFKILLSKIEKDVRV